MAIERDPDDYRDGAILDQVPRERWAETRGLLRGGRGLELDLPQQDDTMRDAEVKELRRRVDRLLDKLRELRPTEEPPTIPDDPGALASFAASLERRIDVAGTPAEHNGWLKHRPVKRHDGMGPVCEYCGKPMAAARGLCRGRPGRY